jgi:hypothetical protein
MVSLLGWYVLVVVVTFVLLFFATSYAQARSSGDFDTQWNTPIGWLLVAATIGVVSVGVIGVYGTKVPFSGRRRDLWPLAFHTVPLVAGWVALAVAASHGRLVGRFRRAEETPTASRPATDRLSIVTGEVESTTEANSPASSRPAVCWTWEFSLRGVAGQSNDNWITRKADSGGVPFDLNDGSGPVRVDPREATITFRMVDEYVCPADAPQPGKVGTNLHRSVPGDEYRYEEGVATDGDPLTVLGTVAEDGTLEATRIYRPETAATASRRYAVRAILAAGGGLVAIWFGIRLAANYFGTPLPV